MARRKFNKRYGWNNQFKNRPLRSDRWDPFPKDHLPFTDDYSVQNFVYSHAANAGIKRSFDDMNTPPTVLGKRRMINDLNSPAGHTRAAKRRAGASATKSLFTNDNVANGAAAAAIGGRMFYTGAGIAKDALNKRVAQGLEDGFASHYRYFYGRSPRVGQPIPGGGGMTFTERSAIPLEELAATDGTAGVDAATGAFMRGQYLTEMAEGLERMLPLIEELLPAVLL